jgi:glycerate-2-kinase
MSKSNETLNSIKELLGLATPKEVVEEINLAEEVVDEVKEVKEEPKKEMEQPNYVTEQQLSEVKNELFLMIQALLEENKKQVKEVPQELAKVEEVKVELEEVSEIVHSPENEVEKKQVNFSKSVVNMTPQERIYAMLNNK